MFVEIRAKVSRRVEEETVRFAVAFWDSGCDVVDVGGSDLGFGIWDLGVGMYTIDIACRAVLSFSNQGWFRNSPDSFIQQFRNRSPLSICKTDEEEEEEEEPRHYSPIHQFTNFTQIQIIHKLEMEVLARFLAFRVIFFRLVCGSEFAKSVNW